MGNPVLQELFSFIIQSPFYKAKFFRRYYRILPIITSKVIKKSNMTKEISFPKYAFMIYSIVYFE